MRTYGNIVARLKAEGTLGLYHDYRIENLSTNKGSLLDHSGNGFHGTLEGSASWTKAGYVFDDAQYIYVSDSAALNTLITRDGITFLFCFDDLQGESDSAIDRASWMSKGESDGTNTYLHINSDDTATEYARLFSTDSGSANHSHLLSNADYAVINKSRRCVAFACKGSTTTVSSYLDGSLVETDTGAEFEGVKSTAPGYAGDLRIGNAFYLTGFITPCLDTLQAVMILSKTATDNEVYQLSNYLLKFKSGDIRRALG